MGLFEILLIGLGLSMDAAAVSMSNGMVYDKMSGSREILMPLFFGFFQAIMPLLGFFLGGIFAEIIEKYAGILIFLILGIIGMKMLWDGWRSSKDEEETAQPTLTVKVLFFQAIATSIDAFAVGVGFCAVRVNILYAVSIIGITTFVLSLIAIFIGKRFGDFLGQKAMMLGGIILIIIGLKAVIVK